MFITLEILASVLLENHKNMFILLQGRFTIAAKHHITIAEIYESETIDIDKVRLILNSERFIYICILVNIVFTRQKGLCF